MPATAHVALGSNLASTAGDRLQTLDAAFDRLDATPGVTVEARSSIWEYDAVGGPPDAPPYLNAVARVRTSLDPSALLWALRQIENDLGRRRTPDRNAPRTLDLDLLLYDDRVIHWPGLDVPHPRMHERRFVLEPLAEVSPHAVHPTMGLTGAELLARVVAGRPVTEAEFLPFASRPGNPVARLNAFDKFCAALAFVAGLALAFVALVSLTKGGGKFTARFDVTPIFVAGAALAAWGTLKSVHVAWQHSPPRPPSDATGHGFPVLPLKPPPPSEPPGPS